MKQKVLVVGAGFSGATVARKLAMEGVEVTIIDRRRHIAGNAYDETNQIGLRVHRYGPHIFHTSNMAVVDFLSNFTTWVPYKHRVKAMLANGELVTLPVNIETARIVGSKNLIDTFFRPYTKKMWGLDLEELDPAIISRVPIRQDTNEFYFPDDTFQAMPEHGYTALVGNMLDHRNIRLNLSTDYDRSFDHEFDHVFNSMSIDEYFGFDMGTLPYRSIKFHHFTIPVPNLFPVSTVNFTHDEKYTRVTEWKNFPNHGYNSSSTTLTVEEPCDFHDNECERYYPVKDSNGKNRELYDKYRLRVSKKQTFIGRCGLYAYLDMHQAVNSALIASHKYIYKKSD